MKNMFKLMKLQLGHKYPYLRKILIAESKKKRDIDRETRDRKIKLKPKPRHWSRSGHGHGLGLRPKFGPVLKFIGPIICSSYSSDWTTTQRVNTAKLLKLENSDKDTIYQAVFHKRIQLIFRFLVQSRVRRIATSNIKMTNNAVNSCDCVSGLTPSETPILWHFYIREGDQHYFFDIRTLNSIKNRKNPYTNVKLKRSDLNRFRKITSLLSHLDIAVHYVNSDPVEKLLSEITDIIGKSNFQFQRDWFTDLNSNDVRHLYRTFRTLFNYFSNAEHLWNLHDIDNISIETVKKELLTDIRHMLTESSRPDINKHVALVFLVNLQDFNSRVQIVEV